MKTSEERSPRFDLNLPVRFYSNDGLYSGHCVNVSATGMLVAFDKPVDIWIKGDLSVLLGGKYVVINARVARVDGKDAGIAFLEDPARRDELIQPLLDYALEQHQPSLGRS